MALTAPARCRSATALLVALAACAPRSQPPTPPPPPSELAEMAQPVRAAYEERSGRLASVFASGAPRAELGTAFGELGMWYHAYRFSVAAQRCYEAALELQPDDARWSYYLGRLHSTAGAFDAAVAAFARAERLPAAKLPALVYAGEVELRRGDLAAAAGHFERALALAPSCARALYGLGQVALQHGDFALAAGRLEAARTHQPDANQIRYSLGLAYRGLDRLPEAERELALADVGSRGQTTVTMRDPLSAALDAVRVDARQHVQAARVARAAGRPDLELAELELGTAADPANREARMNLARAQLKQGRLPEALASFEAAAALDPGNAAARAGIGRVLERLARPDDAEAEYRAALAIDPDLVLAHQSLARLQHRVGRVDEALVHYARAAELDPQDVDARYRLATLQVRSGRAAEAVGGLEAGLQTAPESVPLLRLLARLLATSPVGAGRDPRRALELAERAFERSGDLMSVETVAMAHAALADFEPAIAWQTAAQAAVDASGAPDRYPWVAARLLSYRAGRSLDEPWVADERQTSLEVKGLAAGARARPTP